MLDVGAKLVLFQQRLGGLAALLAFLVALLLLEVPLVLGTQWLGRHLEARLRMAFVQKIPRLGDRYLQSRPMSDMAERSHNSHQLRQLPELAGRFLRQVLEIVLSAAGIIWLDPSSAPRALAAAAAAVLAPLVLQKPFIERDLRVRSHAGGLTRFYLDALLGLTAIRTHGAERMVRREHEGLLVEWARASRALLRTGVMTDVLTTLISLGFATWLFIGALPHMQEMSGTLLLLFWALNIPALGQEIALLARQLPRHRNIVLRLLEPLGALEEPRAPAEEVRGEEPPLAEDAPVALRFEGVHVVAAGNTILSDVELDIAPGEHVAVVGASGAGKSTLVGLLLGWHRASEGRLLVDGRPLSASRLEELRRRTAWVEPSVQLWNSSVIDNLTYGSEALEGVGRVIKAVELQRVLEAMPDGLQTSLGEGGALVSGGEGQRVRLGRALLRSGIRLAVLDEPFRGLDRDLRRALLARSREAWAGVTMLCITHDLAETRVFDRVVVMHEGRILEDGAPEVLATREGSHYRALLETEEQVRQGLWASAAWRRLRMVDGRIIEKEFPV
jgi:ATP-binding cassette subfamily B protein